MGMSTGAGTKLAISAASPATFDATGYAALTHTEIANVEGLGDFGATYEEVAFQPLNGPKLKLKGPADNGGISPTIALDPSDAGQTLLRTAADDKTQKNYSVEITLQDNTVIYTQFICLGFPYSVGAAGAVNTVKPTMVFQKNLVVVPGA